MKTIKIIDLLNKIANGEVPKKIKVDNKFTYIHDGIDYKSDDGTYLLDSYIETTAVDMNKEIEIIEDTPKEEKKIPEKLKDVYINNETMCDVEIYLRQDENVIAHKINEIIDYLKSKGE